MSSHKYPVTGGGGGGAGDVVGPGSATNNALARFSGTTGKLIKNSAVTLDDAGVVSLAGVVDSSLTATRALASDGSGRVVESDVTADELGYLSGVSSAIQTQLDDRISSLTGDVTASGGGAAATTVATVGGSAAADIATAEALANAATDANTSGAIVKRDGSGNFSAGVVTLGADPTAALQAATKRYVDSVAAGLDVKPSVECATTANITLSGEQTLDGILTSASRVLVKNQSSPEENGIYVSAAGAWARAADMDAWAEIPGAFCFVEQGTTYADTAFVCTANAGGTLGTTAVTWSQFAGVGTYAADGSTLDLTGTVFSVKNGGIANAQISASAAIAYTKLALTGAILDADISASAAIAGNKLAAASAAVAGVVTTGTQTIAGAKTFTSPASVAGVTDGSYGATGYVGEVISGSGSRGWGSVQTGAIGWTLNSGGTGQFTLTAGQWLIMVAVTTSTTSGSYSSSAFVLSADTSDSWGPTSNLMASLNLDNMYSIAAPASSTLNHWATSVVSISSSKTIGGKILFDGMSSHIGSASYTFQAVRLSR